MSAFTKFSGSCIVCLTGTDTGLAFGGDREWKAAGLTVLGVPQQEAMAIVERYVDHRDATVTFRVCTTCVRRSGAELPDPALIYSGGEVPCIRPTEEVAR